MKTLQNEDNEGVVQIEVGIDKGCVYVFLMHGEHIMEKRVNAVKCFIFIVIILCFGCATAPDVYHDANMDFGSIQAVAVMPLASFARDNLTAERVRDVLINKLLATGALYVLPPGEVARGVAKAEIANPTAPSPEEIIKLGGIIKVQAIITGAVREYGEVRAGATMANVISMSAQMLETQTGKIVWSSSSTKGGITTADRLFGGGGQPMEKVTGEAVDDLIKRLFK